MQHFVPGKFALLLILLLGSKLLPAQMPLQELLSGLEAEVAASSQPGLGLALVHRDSIIYAGGIGFANTETNWPVTATTQFRVGSVSKSFIALAALQLQEAGKLDLQAKVRDLAPEITFENPWEETDPITVEMLLEHTAGFDDMHFNALYVQEEGNRLPLKDILNRFPNARKSRWRPGTRHSYSNPGYTFAGYLIEKAAGRPLEAYLRDEILRPLAMDTADFVLSPAVEFSLSEGYEAGGQPIQYRDIWHWPAGSLHASPLEMARFVRMMLNRGKIDSLQLISNESLHRMETPRTTRSARAGYPFGYGLANYQGRTRGYVSSGHNGGIDGFSSTYRYYPALGVGYVLLYNRLDVPGKLRTSVVEKIEDFLVPEEPLPLPAKQPLTEEVIARVGEVYRDAAPRNEIMTFLTDRTGHVVTTWRDDTLLIDPFQGDPEPFVHQGEGTFRSVDLPIKSVFFGKTGEGRWMRYRGKYYEESSAWAQIAGLLGLIAAPLLLLTVFFFGMVSGLVRFTGSAKRHFPARYLMAIGTIAVFLSIGLSFALDLKTIGQGGGIEISIFLGSLLFAICSFGALILQIIEFRRHGISLGGGFSFGFALLLCLCTLYLSSYGIIGLRIWAW